MKDSKGSIIVNTGGGGYIGGSVSTGGGHNAGRNVNINTGNEAERTKLAEISAALYQLDAAITKVNIDEALRKEALARFELLESELRKDGKEEKPNAKTVTKVGDWFMENLPEITHALKDLFTTPAVMQAAAAGGALAAAWIHTHFG